MRKSVSESARWARYASLSPSSSSSGGGSTVRGGGPTPTPIISMSMSIPLGFLFLCFPPFGQPLSNGTIQGIMLLRRFYSEGYSVY